MEKINLLLISFMAAMLLLSCNKKEDDNETTGTALGKVTVDIDANKNVVRGGEALLGNMLCDGWMKYAKDSLKIDVDFVLSNGGGMRFSEDIHKDGIYPAGDYTTEIVDEICAFDNNLATAKITGKQLKSILERSVSALPADFEGRFLQCSKELTFTADVSKQVQNLDEVTNPDNPVIIKEGERITSIKINGENYIETATYTVLTIDYLISGGDGYVTFKEVPEADTKKYTNYKLGFIFYLKNYSPITPVKDGRITISGM